MTLNAILIDTYEPPEIKRANYGVPCAVQSLRAGDAWLACDDATIIVERKTPLDLLSSIGDGRLFNQAAEMKAASQWCYLVITAWPHLLPQNWPIHVVMGALASVQEMGVTVMWCENENTYCETLYRIAQRDRGSVKLTPRRIAETLTREEAILAALPGIGAARAKALLEHCGSVAWAMNYLTNGDNDKVPGIGAQTKSAVRAALGLEEGFSLYPLHDSDKCECLKANKK